MQDDSLSAAAPESQSRPKLGALSEMFGIDVRSLAAFRVGMAALLLLDLWRRVQNLVSHYTDYGVLPRTAWTGFYAVRDTSGRRFWWSIHFLSGEPWFQCVLFCLAVVLALLLLVGYRTRLATVASWAMLASLQSRNPLVNSAGDDVAVCLLFWAMFLPLGAAWSVDFWLQPNNNSRPKRVFSAASVALLLQVAIIYVFSAVWKRGPCWTVEYSAVYYALNMDAYTTPLAARLLAYPALMRFLTISSYWLEWIGPVVAFSPVLRAPLRMLAVVTFWSFHLGTMFFLHLDIFPWVMMVAWTAFIPSGCWDLLARRVGPGRRATVTQWVSRVSGFRPKYFWLRYPATPCWRIGWVQSVVVSLLLLYTIAWNVCGAFPRSFQPRPGWNVIGRLTRLNQQWSMFAPCPLTDDGWFILRGVLRDGSEVNLWQPGELVPFTKPQQVFKSYVDDRNQKMLETLWHSDHSKLRMCFLDWLRWRWDREHAGKDPRRRLKRAEMIYMLELTPPLGEPLPVPEPVVLEEKVYES